MPRIVHFNKLLNMGVKFVFKPTQSFYFIKSHLTENGFVYIPNIKNISYLVMPNTQNQVI